MPGGGVGEGRGRVGWPEQFAEEGTPLEACEGHVGGGGAGFGG